MCPTCSCAVCMKTRLSLSTPLSMRDLEFRRLKRCLADAPSLWRAVHHCRRHAVTQLFIAIHKTSMTLQPRCRVSSTTHHWLTVYEGRERSGLRNWEPGTARCGSGLTLSGIFDHVS